MVLIGSRPVCADPVAAPGQEQDYDRIASEISGLLSAIEIPIVSVAGSEVRLAPNTELRPGMRLRLLRKGTVFIHPVTREPFGEGRRDVGIIEVREVLQDGAVATVLEGTPEEGDYARRPESGLRVLISYDELTHPRVVDQTYAALQKIQRLVVADGGPGELQDRLDYALERNADALVYVTTSLTTRSVALFVTGSNNTPVQTWESAYTPEPVRIERAPGRDTLSELQWVSFKFPFTGRSIGAADVDNDGIQDILIGEKRTVHVFRLEGEGVREMNAFEVVGRGTILSLGTYTFPGDAAPSIVVTTLEERGVAKVILTSQEKEGSLATIVDTRIYQYSQDAGYRKVWHANNIFGRASLDGVFVQNYSDATGFQGPVRELVKQEDRFVTRESAAVPQDINLYDFLLVDPLVMRYSPEGALVVSRPDGGSLWKSDAKYGNGEMTVKLPVFSEGMGKEVLRRIPLCRARGGSRQVFAFRNNPFVGAIPGLGYSSVDLTGLVVSPTGSVEEKWKMGQVPGRLVDMTVLQDGRLAVLLVPYVHLRDPIFEPIDYVQARSAVVVVDTRER